MKTFLNWHGPRGKETVDEFNSEDYQQFAEFRKQVLYAIREYRISEMNVYESSRKCKNW